MFAHIMQSPTAGRPPPRREERPAMALPAIHFRIGRPDFEIAVAAFRSVRAALPLPLAGPPELHLDAGAIDAIHGSPRAPLGRWERC